MDKIIKFIKKTFKNKRLLKNILLFSGSSFIIFLGLVTIYLGSLKIPDFQAFEARKVLNSTQIFDRTGEILLYDLHQDVKRTDISFVRMSQNIKTATVAIEDAEFYNHGGIRITSIIRAVLSNIFSTGRTQGGSTITQQLVKNTLLTQEKSYTRKIKEWVLAVKIDKSIPKDKILEYYLNEAPYGGNVYGVEEASQTYFTKPAANLTLAEAAYLAAIPQSPSLLSPYGKHRDRLEARKNLVLSRMHELKFISDDEYDQAKNEVVTFSPQATSGIKAPHFVFFIKDYLESKYGTDVVERGLKVTTTLDYDLQVMGETFVKEGALKNEKDWNGKNAGLVAIDPKTGQILTMVGSRDYFDKNIDGNYNIATAERQPGSSFKPFIYATAFNKGFTEDTVLFDLPTEFQTTCNVDGKALPGHSQAECYKPDNYDGKFRGPMKLRDALAQSINIPAVKLFYLTKPADSLKTAESMGITTLKDIGRYGLTLVIGGGEVSLLDMTSAYSVFANSGIRNPYTGVLRVEDSNGNVLEEYKPQAEEVLPRNTALTISDILSDNQARIPTFGAFSPLNIAGRQVAVKTGTTNNNKDAWTIGYTPSIAVGVWAGNNNNTPMKKGGSAMAGPIWNKFMTEALKKMPSETFETPERELDYSKIKPVLRGVWQGNESFLIDKISGKLATENTPPESTEERAITNVHTILYWINRDDVTGPPPENPSANPQFEHWEVPVQRWWAEHRGGYPVTSLSDRPNETDDVHTDLNKPTVKVLSPDSHKVYSPDEPIELRVESSGPYPLSKIELFINGNYVETLTSPFRYSFIPKSLENLDDYNEIKLVFYDTAYNKGEEIVRFEVEN